MKVLLFGAKATELESEIDKHDALRVVESEPEVVISYGGDGTLLTAERRWPGVPKVPIRNSRRGHRTLHNPPSETIRALAEGSLVPHEFIKLECALRQPDANEPEHRLVAMNEFSVNASRVNSAVRFKIWINDEVHGNGNEIIGDGLVVSTPFGSTAYFNHITRGIFYEGIGVAFKYVAEQTNHLVLPEDAQVRVLITRGPAGLAYDSAREYYDLYEGSELRLRKTGQSAVIYTFGPAYRHPSQSF